MTEKLKIHQYKNSGGKRGGKMNSRSEEIDPLSGVQFGILFKSKELRTANH